MLEHNELDALLNWIDWDQPLTPLDLNLPTDPDIITLLPSSTPISPVALRNQPPNPLVDKVLQSSTNTPIQFTDHHANSQQESRVKILLPSLCGSKTHSHKTKSEELQSISSSSKRLRSNSKALRTSTQDAKASLSRTNRFRRNQQILKEKRKKCPYRHHKSVRRLRHNARIHYQLTNAFSSWEIVFWDYKRQEYTIQNTALSSQRLVVPLKAIEVRPVEWQWTHKHPCLSQKTVHEYSQYTALNCWQKWMHPPHKM